MSELDTRIGRVFMAGMPGPYLDTDTAALIRDYCIGGIILFKRNILTPVQLAELCKNLQETAMEYHGIPLLLAVDQEGGRVARLRDPFTEFPGNEAIGASPRPEEEARRFAEVTSREMALVGLTMNMAPVVDVRRGAADAHLTGRTFGEGPRMVGNLGRVVIETLQEHGIMATAKHFPGLGRATTDPHHHLPTIEVDLRELDTVNLPPFHEAIRAGVSAVMTSHAVYPALDPALPATLSRSILTDLLRERMGFAGLIVTDDLEMGAVKKTWGVAEAAGASFDAGADILLICEHQNLVVDAIGLMRKRVLGGDLGFHRLQQSVERVAEAKRRFLGRPPKVSLQKVTRHFMK